MRTQHLPHLILMLLLIGPIASCSSKPKPQTQTTPSPSPAISITKPINKAKDAKTTVEEVGKQREQLNPETAPTQP
jgi:type IV pilus biogenesis protein CpaD/CtpE